MNGITQTLRCVRWRMEAQHFLDRLTACGLAAGAAFFCRLGWKLWQGRGTPGGVEIFGVSSLALIAALAWTAARRASLHETAARIDALAQTRDRFVTALAFSEKARGSELEKCALAECGRFIAGFDARRFTRLRWPRRAAWLLAPALGCCAMLGLAHFVREKNPPDPAAEALTGEKARELEILARQIDKANEAEKNDELKKLAEALRRSEARLREASCSRDAANKAVLRELSSLEAMAEAARNAKAQELAALAQALRQAASATKEAGAALERGELASGAEQLEKIARETARQSAAEREKLARALRQALAEVEAGELSKSAGELAASGDAPRALQKLAEALRRLAGEPQRGRAGGKNQTLQQAIAALQEMKAGRAEHGDAGDGGAARGQIAMQDFQKEGEPRTGALADAGAPGGQAGGEHDTGTTQTPLGPAQKRAAENENASLISGAPGEGESLQSLVTTHGGSAQSSRRYRALYDAARPAAEDALQQENIPLGSRFFVRRYFENIRPKE